MNKLEQARHHAATLLLKLFDLANYDASDLTQTKQALELVDAIADYANKLRDEQIINTANSNPLDP